MAEPTTKAGWRYLKTIPPKPRERYFATSDAVVDIEAEARASLDVERLYRALYRAERGDVPPTSAAREIYRRQKAATIAAEYERLSRG